MQIGPGHPTALPDLQGPQNQINAPAFETLLVSNPAAAGSEVSANIASPMTDLGERLLDRLGEFADRAKEFSRVTMADKTAQSPSEDRMKGAVAALEKMFDHSIEVQLVVRGTTQVSGSANTLLRGQ